MTDSGDQTKGDKKEGLAVVNSNPFLLFYLIELSEGLLCAIIPESCGRTLNLLFLWILKVFMKGSCW